MVNCTMWIKRAKTAWNIVMIIACYLELWRKSFCGVTKQDVSIWYSCSIFLGATYFTPVCESSFLQTNQRAHFRHSCPKKLEWWDCFAIIIPWLSLFGQVKVVPLKNRLCLNFSSKKREIVAVALSSDKNGFVTLLWPLWHPDFTLRNSLDYKNNIDGSF